MDFGSIILVLLIYIGLFYLLKSVINKNNNSYKRKVIFSYSFFGFILFVSLISYLGDRGKFIWDDVRTISLFFIFINTWLFLDYRKSNLLNNEKVRIFRFTYLKGVKLITIIVPVFFTFLLFIILIINDFKAINGVAVLSIILIILSFFWALLYFRNLKLNKFKSESIIIYTDDTYIKYELFNKTFFRLSKIIDQSYSVDLKKSFILYLTQNNSKEFVWVIYLEKTTLKDNSNNNKELLEILKSLDCKIAEINLDNLTTQIIS